MPPPVGGQQWSLPGSFTGRGVTLAVDAPKCLSRNEILDFSTVQIVVSEGTSQVVRHEVACVEWRVGWRSAVTLMT